MIDVLTVINSKDQLARSVYASFLSAIIIGVGTVVYGPSNIAYYLAFSIFLVNIFFSFEQRNSKILAALLLGIVYVLMVATNNNNGLNGDYRAYNELYTHFLYGGSISNIIGYKAEYGYMLLMLAAAKIGLSYNMFIAILAAISIKLIHSTISKITQNYNLVLACYALSPFFYDVFQFRYFFAYSVIIFALQYILIEGKKSYFKYILLVLFATLFHKTIIFFLLYLVLKMNIKSLIKLATFSSVFIALASFITKKNIIDVLYSFINFSKFESYTSGTIQYKLNTFTPLAIALMILYFVLIARSIYNKEQSYMNRQIMWINLLNILLFPFLLVSLDFERFMRPIFLINYALIGENNKLFGSKRKIILFSLIVVLSARQFLMSDISSSVLENNFIFEYFNEMLK